MCGAVWCGHKGAFVVVVRWFKIPTLFTWKLPVKMMGLMESCLITIGYLSNLKACLWGLIFVLIVHLRSLKASLKKMRYTCPFILASILDLRDGNTSAAMSVTRCWKIKGRRMMKLIQKIWGRFNPRNVRPVCHDTASPPPRPPFLDVACGSTTASAPRANWDVAGKGGSGQQKLIASMISISLGRVNGTTSDPNYR